MKSTKILGAMLALSSISGSYAYANETNETNEANEAKEFSARLSGFNEVPLTILSPGTGTLQLSIDTAAATIKYTLSYSGVTTPVTQAHIHFGKKHTAGGIIAFLCSNLANPPAGTPPCPQFEGTVSGTITAGQVVAQEQQNFSGGDFNALVSAIVSETSYANVHTTKFPAGEIRGQIRDVNHSDHHGDNHGNNHEHNSEKK